jgi:uncharacterized protein with NRDE domain
MCLILFSYQIHPVYPLILLANRDEFYHRPTRSLDFWTESRDILGGLDLKCRGTWLGMSKSGRMAAITNYRNLASPKSTPEPMINNAPSRGHLVKNFIAGNLTPIKYLKGVQSAGNQYNGFNLIIFDPTNLYYYSNIGLEIQKLGPGFFGLSNHLLNTQWPKVQKGLRAFKSWITGNRSLDLENGFSILSDQSRPPDERLPNTGIGITWERILSPIFVSSRIYGTRSSSIILVDYSGNVQFAERTHPIGTKFQSAQTRKYSFTIHP